MFDFDDLKVGDRIVIDCIQESGVELLNLDFTVISKTSEQATGCAHAIWYEIAEPWWYPINSATLRFSSPRFSGTYYNQEYRRELNWGIGFSGPGFSGLWYRFG